MNNLDDWLNAIGIDDMNIQQESPHQEPVEENSTMPTVAPPPQEEPILQNLSESDFDDILNNVGFNVIQEAEVVEEEDGEEIQEDSTVEESSSISSESIEEESSTESLPTEQLEENTLVEDNVSPQPLLNPNSPTLLMDDSTSRFSGAEWYREIMKKIIIVAGCGGIGSNLIFQLSRMHPSAIHIYDADTVETVNMSGQLFCREDIGEKKVDAITRMVLQYTSAEHIYAYPQMYLETSSTADIMACGFDNMEARKLFFTKWLNHVLQQPEEDRKNCLYLDGRLSIDTLQVFCITGDAEHYIQRYRKEFLFDDSQADETICSLKQTTYLACMVASVMTNLFTNFVANSLNPILPYDLPFFTEYDAQNMIFKTEK